VQYNLFCYNVKWTFILTLVWISHLNVFSPFHALFEMVVLPPKHSLMHHHTWMLLDNLNLPTLECWDCSYLPCPSPLLVYDTSTMLINIQIASFVCLL
jgi:hypothetical protein